MSIVLLLLAVTLWAVVHSWLASLGVKAWARQHLGAAVVDRGYRLFYNLFASLSFFPVVLLMTSLPDRVLYSIPAFLLAELVALILLVIAFRQTGPMAFIGLQQLFEPEPEPAKLVTSGLYRWVRHPIYLASLLFLGFYPFMSVNTLVVFSALAVYFFVGAHFEEKKLVREFGMDYIAYQQNTAMIIPGLRFAAMRARMRKLL